MTKAIERPSTNKAHSISDHDNAIADILVTERSRWSDVRWQFEPKKVGGHSYSCRLNWSIELDDGSKLTDEANLEVLAWLKHLVYGLVNDPGDGASALSGSTMGQVQASMRIAVPWLVSNGLTLPKQITEEATDRFLEDLPFRIALGKDHDESTCRKGSARDLDEESVLLGSASAGIRFFKYLWRQRLSLLKAGFEPMPTEPWPRQGYESLGKHVSAKARGWISPLPEEVLVPLLNAALGYIGSRGNDILNVRDQCEEAYRLPDLKGRSVRLLAQRKAATQFSFSKIDGADQPWRPPLGRLDSTTPMADLKNAAKDLGAACCLIVQATTGIRVSELCSIQAGSNAKTGLPQCIEQRVSPTGHHDQFFLKGAVSKGVSYPTRTTWLAGQRRRGDSELPLCVQALALLDRLFGPYRELLGSNALLVSIMGRNGLPKKAGGVNHSSVTQINRQYKFFAKRKVDWDALPNESAYATELNDLLRWKDSRGAVLRGHSIRKNYALWVHAVNPSLLPALQRQFKHVNMQITELGYWGSSAPQLEHFESASRRLVARMIRDKVNGEIAVHGRRSSVFTSELEKLRARLNGLSLIGQWTEIGRWVEQSRLDTFHTEYGICMPVSSAHMECWARVGQRPVGRLYPNYGAREAGTCVGCKSFLMHSSHKAFWQKRLRDCEDSLARAMREEVDASSLREINRRAKQARRIVEGLGKA
ncbi:hypothetical protein [Oleiagrimonas sp. C23AA]|uniref:hypothetical protein n=1 Tax=Oleiagrimonas sp. C23AA TaxID=2719047 RepID=UPI001421DB2B|nr:hypothetical protein [Oleiagrimonas sp. C23AA]NII10672.1 hypothetical protein [Oleiagrimonas sp. C23AA]